MCGLYMRIYSLILYYPSKNGGCSPIPVVARIVVCVGVDQQHAIPKYSAPQPAAYSLVPSRE